MTEQTETSSDEPGEQTITVRRLVPTQGITPRQIVRAVRATLNGRSVRTISVAIVDDARMAKLHERYLGDPRATDVLTFDLRDDPDDEAIEGEVVVSAETARRQAARRRLTEAEELLRYVIHGTLHLLGYDDDTPVGRSRMRQAEDRVLAGLERPGRESRSKRAVPRQ